MLKGKELIAQVKTDFLESKDNTNHVFMRKKMREAFGMVSGGEGDDTEQWDKDTLAILREQDRPAVTFNRIEPMIEGIVGSEVNNRMVPNFKAREPDDSGVNEAITEVAKWARDNDIEEEETDAFRDAIICGLGGTISTMEYDEDPDGKFVVVRSDPLGFRWDPSARRPCLADTRWRGVLEDISLSEFREMFGRKAVPSKAIFGDSGPLDGSAGETPEQEPSDYDDPNISNQDSPELGKVRVFEYQWWEREPIVRVLNQTTRKLEELSEAAFNKLRKRGEAAEPPVIFEEFNERAKTPGAIRFIRQKRKRFYRAFFSGDAIVGDPEESAWRRGFTLQFITGRRDHNRAIWYGLVRAMTDPQRFANKFLSQFIHQYNSNIKGGMIAEKGAFVDIEDAENKLASPAPLLEVEAGAIGKILPLQPAQMSPALAALIDIAQNAPPQVTGINAEFIGLAGRDQPIGLEQTRKLATMTIIAPIFSSLRRFRKQGGRLLLDYMRDYFSLETMARVVSSDVRQFVPQIVDTDTSRYDVHIDDAPLSPSSKATVFSVLKDFLQFMPPGALQVYIPWFLDYSPLPSALVADLKKAMQQAQQPDPQKEEIKQLEVSQREADVFETTAKGAHKLAQAASETAGVDLKGEELEIERQDQTFNLVQTAMQSAASLQKKE